MSDIRTNAPEWAIKAALSRFPRPFFLDGDPWTIGHIKIRSGVYADSVRFLAEQIAEHEEAPVDPLLIKAREIVAWNQSGLYSTSEQRSIERGDQDNSEPVRVALAALKSCETSS